MQDVLTLADLRLLLTLNHALAAHPALYDVALFLTDEGADLALGVTAAWLWFWPWGRSWAAPPAVAPATRGESRARLLAFGVAGMCAYVIARMIAFNVDLDRPFVTWLPVRGNPGAFEGLRTFGAFPSDHAALLGALPVAFRYWSGRLAVLWLGLGVFLIFVRVAVGFHYPSDMLAGAAIGAACAAAGMWAFDRIEAVRALALRVGRGFSVAPAAYVLYPLLALAGLEFAMHFKHVLQALIWLQYRI